MITTSSELELQPHGALWYMGLLPTPAPSKEEFDYHRRRRMTYYEDMSTEALWFGCSSHCLMLPLWFWLCFSVSLSWLLVLQSRFCSCHRYIFTHSVKHMGLDSNSFPYYQHHLPAFSSPHKRGESAIAKQIRRQAKGNDGWVTAATSEHVMEHLSTWFKINQ